MAPNASLQSSKNSNENIWRQGLKRTFAIGASSEYGVGTKILVKV
jgi:trans-2-enoyl-CoA reductase